MTPKIFYIDLFSGAGGTTTGVHLAGAEVVACVNHDEKAIESHKANHPNCLHFVEDVRDYKVIKAIKRIVDKLRKEHPGCVIVLWSSLECTNYSKAKGGQPRDADSRTLAYTLYNYIDEIQPDLVQIENVREFMAWGPLDEQGRPVSRKNGIHYQGWIRYIERMGYEYDYRILNAANYGAYTSRERYFGQFATNGFPIKWPEATHAKEPQKGGLFESALKKWKPVREVLDLYDEGVSIFGRKKPLVEATLKRILAGLFKFVGSGEKSFTKVYNSGNDLSRVKSLHEPVGTLTTQNSHALVKCKFMMKNYSGHPKSKVHSLECPAGTVTTIDHNSIVSVDKEFLTTYYGNGGAHDIKQPCPTVTTKDRFTLVKPQFMDNQYKNGAPTSIHEPNGTLTTVPKQKVVTVNKWLMNTNFNNVGSSIHEPAPTILACRKHHYLMNPQFNNKGASIDKPCFTLIAKMDKRPPSLITPSQVNHSKVVIIESLRTNVHPVKVTKKGTLVYYLPLLENETMKEIILFMAAHLITDIKMRMLKIPELLQIQGFPKDYVLKGTQADQKKFIGNAVEVNMAKAIALSTQEAIVNYLKENAA